MALFTNTTIANRRLCLQNNWICVSKIFYCVFVRFAMNLIVFSGPRHCVNMQYAALSRAMVEHTSSMHLRYRKN